MATRYILSTGNIMTAGAEVIRKPTLEKSNTELINSLRENFKAASSVPISAGSSSSNSSSSSSSSSDYNDKKLAPHEWIKMGPDGVTYIPAAVSNPEVLLEERGEYDITVKLFYLPGVHPSLRCQHTTDAVRLVCESLGTTHLDLFIVSFPNISFDADDEDTSPESDVTEWARTYRTLETLHAQGKISRIGLSEFGTTRLDQLLPHTTVKPSVDQINVRDCCVVPRPLIVYAKERGIELLTHNDCTDILPAETLGEVLVGEFGICEKGAKMVPQWVVKYTAVIRSRGVVENKGYIAMAEV